MLANILDFHFIKKHKIASVIIAYFLVGILFVVSGYLHSFIIGKDIVFHPIVGVLFSYAWPMWIYATLNHTGITFPIIVGFIAIILLVIIFVKSWYRRAK